MGPPLALAAGTALLLLRQRGAGALDTLWAEDGEIFLQQALEDASPAGWLRGYAGYLHLLPRMIASIAALLPLEWAPLVLSVTGALAASAVALVTFHAAEQHIPAWRLRALLALALLLLPAAGLEITNATANIHWYLLAALGWVALWRPRHAAGVGVGSAFLFLTAASDPFGVLAAPVLAWRLLRGAQPVDWAFATALGAGALLQAGGMLASAGSRPLDPFATPVAVLASWYGFHVLEGAAFGVSLRAWTNEALGVAGTAAAALVVLAVLLTPAVRAAARRPGLVPVALAGLHFGLFFVPVALAGVSTPRYAVAPILLLYGLAAWGSVWSDVRRWRVALLLAAAVPCLAFVLDFAPRNLRAEGPRWSRSLAAARERCSVEPGGLVDVQVPPRTDLDEVGLENDRLWVIQIPCQRLQEAQAAGGR